MPSNQQPAPSTSLGIAKLRFKIWRETRKPKTRIPDELWKEAAELSGQYSVHRISKTLCLNHSALRDRIAALKTSEKIEHSHGGCFLELPPPQSSPASECLIEMENRHGEKMRMHFAGEVSLDLFALSRDFWCRRS